MTDRGRASVYAAEIAAFESTSYESICSFDDLLELHGVIVGASWWPNGVVSVVAARSDAASSSTLQHRGDAPVVRLAAPQMTPATLVHELAHVLAGVGSGHGGSFRRAHVDLVGFAFGDEPAGWLIDAYADLGLELGRRRWPMPPLTRRVGGPIAL
jgi:hypothetical protein